MYTDFVLYSNPITKRKGENVLLCLKIKLIEEQKYVT